MLNNSSSWPLFCSFQSATFPQINCKSISFDEQTVHRFSVEAATTASDDPPIQSRSFDAVVNECHHSTGNSELNLHSLSSDSGLHTEKTSEMSSGDFTSKMEDDQPSPTSAETNNKGSPSPGSDNNNKGAAPVRLSRVGSVKSRVNIFQHLDNKQNAAPTASATGTESKRPTPKKCKLLCFGCWEYPPR